MVRIRHSDSVKIQISGPRKVIPHTRIEIGRRSMTWKQFLLDVCGFRLNSKKEYFICTAGYSPNHSVEGRTASLNDPIELFVKNYIKNLKKYSVRLHNGPAPLNTEDPQVPNKIQLKSEVRSQNKSSIYSSPQKPITSLAAKKFASISPLKPSQFAELTCEQNVETNLLDNGSSKSGTKMTLRKRKRRTLKEKTYSRSVRVTESKLVLRNRRSTCEDELSPPKLVRNDNTIDKDIINGGCSMTRNFNVKQEQLEMIMTDFLELDDGDQDINLNNVQDNSSIADKLNEGESQFDKLISTNKLENAACLIDKERRQSGPEMQDLLKRFEESIDSFDESLLEQIKLEVVALKKSGVWGRNMKRSPLACFLIEEICKA